MLGNWLSGLFRVDLPQPRTAMAAVELIAVRKSFVTGAGEFVA